MANTLAKSILVPDAFRNKPADVFMAITYGLELGMPPVTSLMSIAVIKGKPTLYAASMVALVLSSGKARYFRCVESDANLAIYETQRIGDSSPHRKEFSQENAKVAGLGGGMYSKYPQQMLEARAKAYLARDVYPDVLHGLMSTEEAREIEPDYGVGTADFETPPEPPAELSTDVAEQISEINDESIGIIDQMRGCRTIDELNGLMPQLKLLDGDERALARDVYVEMKTAILEAAQ